MRKRKKMDHIEYGTLVVIAWLIAVMVIMLWVINANLVEINDKLEGGSNQTKLQQIKEILKEDG